MSIINEFVEIEKCPICGKSGILCSIGIYSKLRICDSCREEDELYDFLGILPGGVVSG